MHKKIWLFSAIVYTAVLTTVSLMTLKNLPTMGISFADKIFHFSAYFVFTVLWAFAIFYNFHYEKAKTLRYAFFISVAFGTFIEVLQGTLTVARSFDVYDMLANTSGAILATAVLFFYSFKQIKKL